MKPSPNAILRTAPHLVETQPFLIPLQSRAHARAVGLGLWLYDLTGGLRIGHRHRRVKPEDAAEHVPALDPERFSSAYLYWDAKADDVRLTLAVVMTAVHRFGTPALNHLEAVGVEKAAGRVAALRVADRLDGRELTVSAPVMINAAGVWADEVRQLDEGHDPDSIRPAKGVHITVPRDRLPTNSAAVLPVPNDRRSVFVIPWGDHVYIGTTDTDYAGPLDEPVCTREEVEYLLETVNSWVREPITPGDVVGTWAGLRPLGKGTDDERTADLSRRHTVRVSGSGLVTITGGKLTTYRRMATDAVDAAFEVLERKGPATRTKRMPLHGAEGADTMTGAKAAKSLGVTEFTLEHLVRRFGSQARAVALLARERPELAEPLVPGLPYLKAEAVYSVRHEMAATLDDVLSRRTRALLLDREATVDAAPAVAELLSGELHWDDAEIRRQVDEFIVLAEQMRTGLADVGGAAGARPVSS